jgi:hypothetical protein
MDHTLPPPAWVSKRDGRLEPFDADKISRSLFAATESLGRPNAFLARELTDGVVHFLKAEFENAIPTTAQVTELVAKVVRELGQPALAHAYSASRQRSAISDQQTPETGPPVRALGPTLTQIGQWVNAEVSPTGLLRRVGQACLREYSLREIFTRDLAAAHEEGLLTITGLEAPGELYGYQLEVQPSGAQGLACLADEARAIAGRVLALDGLDHALRPDPDEGEALVTGAFANLVRTLEQTGLRAVVNLNSASPPRWASDLAEGPLFGPALAWRPPSVLDAVRDSWLGQWAALPAGVPIRVDWHLSDQDTEDGARVRLTGLVRRALGGLLLTFVFDRPRRPISLAEGLDRQHPGILLVVGLHLPALRERQGPSADTAGYLQKLGSLARLALSAAAQKRDFLRRHSEGRPGLRRGFLLERARLVVVPVGLEAVVHALAGRGLSAGTGLELARQILRRLREVLEQDGRASHLETCLDSAAALSLEGDAVLSAEQVAGLTPWDATLPPRQQVKAAGHLHGVAEGGTAAILVPQDQPLAVDDAVEVVRYAQRHTDAHRLCFLRASPPQHQLTAPWDAG